MTFPISGPLDHLLQTLPQPLYTAKAKRDVLMQVRLGSGEARQGDPMVAWRFSFHMASSRKGSESSDYRSEHHAGFVVLSVGSLPSGSARLSTSQ